MSSRTPPRPAPAAPPVAPRHEFAIVLALAAAHFALYQTICAIKFRYFLYADFDLAIFTQAIHGVMHGWWFNSVRGMDWLGDHSSLILIPLAPLFALAPHALTLLAMQSLALAAGAIPVWRLARRELPPGPLPVLCAALYLLHPALGYLNLFEFHPETLAVPFLLWATLEVRAGRTGRAAIAAGIALLAREDVVLPVLGLAAVAVLSRPRHVRMAVVLVALAVASVVLSFGVLKPMLLAGEATYGKMYARWGATPGQALLGLLEHPLDAVSAFWSSPGDLNDTLLKRQFWVQIFLPVGALSLLGPLWLLPALPVFAEHMWSNRTYQHTIVFQYAALMIPFVAASAVFGLRRLTGWLPGGRAPAVLAALLVLLALATQWMFGAVAGHRIGQALAMNEANTPDPFQRAMKPYRDRMLARVPREGAVIAGFEFLSHLATRRELHSMHQVLSGKYTYSDRDYPMPRDVRAILGDMCIEIPYLRFDTGARLRAISAEHDLRPADAAGGTVLLLPGARDSVEFYRVGATWAHRQRLDLLADGELTFIGTECEDSTVARGGVLRFKSYWKRVAPAHRNYLSQAWIIQGREVAVYGRARPLGYGIFPAADWPKDSVVTETYHLLIPDDVAPGTYTPIFRLVSVDENGQQQIPIVRVGNVHEPMNAIGLRAITVTEEHAFPKRAPR